MADATLKQVGDFFRNGDPSYTLKMFGDDWKVLGDEDKAQIKAGIGNGSFTY